MGRELRRKQAKKDGRSLEKETLDANNQFKKYLINVFVIVGIFSLIYLLSALFITKEVNWFSKDKTKDDTSSTSSVANSILASVIFKQSEESYYVYFYDFDEEAKDSAITTLVNNNLTTSKVYKVDTSSAMNANFVGETGNKNAKSLEDLKVVNHTLIKVTGETISEYYEEDEITKKLSN